MPPDGIIDGVTGETGLSVGVFRGPKCTSGTIRALENRREYLMADFNMANDVEVCNYRTVSASDFVFK
jgi:hypothetical protein